MAMSGLSLSSPSPAVRHHAGALQSIHLLVLRLAAGGLMILFRGWTEVIVAWDFLWKDDRSAWALCETVKSWGVPQPVVVTSAVVLLGFAACCLLILGLVTRLSALVLLLITGFVLFKSFGQEGARVELTVFYVVSYFLLLLSGPGLVSLDALLKRR